MIKSCNPYYKNTIITKGRMIIIKDIIIVNNAFHAENCVLLLNILRK